MQLSRLDVFPLDDVGCDSANDSRDLWHPRDRDEDDDQPELRAEEGNEKQDEDDLGEREDDVHAAHQEVIGDRPGVRGEQTDRRADRDADGGGGEGHPKNASSSPQDAGEHVVAEVVGAEQELSGRGACG